MSTKKQEKPVIVQPVMIFMLAIIMTTIAIVMTDNMNLEGFPANWVKNVSFDTIGMLTALAIMFSLIMETRQSRKTLKFMRLVSITSATMFFDMTCWLFDGVTQYALIVKLSNTCFYIFGIAVGIFFWDYLKEELELNKRHHNVLGAIAHFLMVMNIFSIIVNWWTGWCFTVDAAGVYHRSDHFWFTYLPTIYIFCVLIGVIIHHKMPFFEKAILLTYEAAPVCAMFVQATNYGLSIIYPSCLLAELIIYGNIYLKRARQMAEQEAKLAEQNIAIMVSQIQPHFLYNTLTTISNLCRKDPEKAEDATVMFSRYLRMNLDSLKKMEPVMFAAEIEHVKIYLELEQMRFGDQLNVEYDIKESKFKIPALSIQPIAENSVKHGIREKDGPGTIKISTRRDGDFYEIVIEDDGVGFDTTKPIVEDGRTHVGMNNVLDRLREMSNATTEVISSPGNGCKTIIRVPVEEAKQ